MPEQDQTHTAQWTPISYDIVFNANTGTGTMANQTLSYDTPATLTPNSFTRTGWTFTGWNTSPDGTATSYANEAAVENLTSTNNDEITLYAQWTQDTHTINFLDHDGTNLNTQTVAHGDDATAPTSPTRTGYTFTGWSPSDLTNITADTDFTAQYSINQYTLTFDSA